MKKFRVGFIIDNLEPDKYIIDLINFINQNESFESPILITGYSQKNSEPLIKKFINNFRLNKVLKSIFLKIILVIEKRIVSKKYQNKETSAEKITIYIQNKIKFNLLYDKNKSLQKKIKLEQLRKETF